MLRMYRFHTKLFKKATENLCCILLLKNWDGSRGDLEDLNIDTILAKDVHKDSQFLQKVKFDLKCSMVLRH